MSNELYDRLEQFVAEAESSREEAYEESIRQRKAEKEVIDAIHQVKSQHFFLVFFHRKYTVMVLCTQTCNCVTMLQSYSFLPIKL